MRSLHLVTASGEITVKSPRTRRRWLDRLAANVAAATGRSLDARPLDSGRLLVRLEGDEPTAVARVFGVQRVERLRELAWSGDGLDPLAAVVADAAADRVVGRSFAVRVQRTGQHDFRSLDVEAEAGRRLEPGADGVDLTDPDVTVRVLVRDDAAWLRDRRTAGPGGLPLGVQQPALALLSGGFDSAVAAWQLLRRGSPVDLLHVQLRCAQRDHALAVGGELFRRWGAGHDPRAWIVDFEPVERGLRTEVAPQHRQLVLKRLMFRVADRVAERAGIPALVSGDAVGQVSTQTLTNLAAVDRASERLVLRPLAGWDKHEIVTRAHELGVGELAARAQEVCDLSGGSPVVIAASADRAAELEADLPDGLVDEALASLRTIRIADWHPGAEPTPVDAPAAAAEPSRSGAGAGPRLAGTRGR